MIFTLLAGLLLLLFIWDYFAKKHRNDVMRKSNITGLPALPLVGNIWEFRNIDNEKILDYMRTSVLERNKFYRGWMFQQLGIVCTDVNTLEELLSSQELITKNFVYDMIEPWLGNGLLLSTGKKWHTRRKIITPTFHFKILEQFVEIFDQQSSVLTEKLRPLADGKTAVDVFPLICLMALDIIAETAMGVKIDAQNNPQVGYVASVRKVTDILGERIRRPLWGTDLTFRLFAPHFYKELKQNINSMHCFTNDVIQKRRETLERKIKEESANQTHTEDDDIGLKKRMALLDVLLQANVDGKPLSNEDIREEVETFMFAGHDTTTSGSSFALYLIARHPEVQQKLFEEIRNVIGDDKDKPISYRELQELKYMECVIKEALRLYPPVPIVGRYFSHDVTLNKRKIPGNTHFNVAIFIIMRDPDYFEDPNDFKPERFLPEHIQKVPTFAYLPFSAGPRNCIGQKYAMLEMKSTISKILRNFELLPLGAEVQPMLSMVLRSKTGMNVGLKPRVYA